MSNKIGVSLSIDVTKIEKARLIAGKKGKYLDATVFIDLGEADQYGNHGFIAQSVSKEEREQGVKGPILGNVKVFYRDDSSQQRPAAAQSAPRKAASGGESFDDFDQDIPF